MTDSPLKAAIRLAGGQTALARTLGIRAPSIIGWGDTAPLSRCAAIEAATGGAVRADDLRPDVEWRRDNMGQITGYTVRVKAS
jgi:DNA-binding transcriptional regulator YdaS (Cro superfamily)